MRFSKSGQEIKFLTTEIENVFITEYMTQVPGDYTKVYLYGLFCGTHQIDMEKENFAETLGISKETVDDAWTYWTEQGLVEINQNQLQFKSARDVLFTLKKKALSKEDFFEEKIPMEEKKDSFSKGKVEELFANIETFKGSPLSVTDMREISFWLEEDGIEAEMIQGVYEYCYNKCKGNINYVGKILLDWKEKGIHTREDVEERIKTLSERQSLYRKIVSSLGITRMATAVEREMIDDWVDHRGFSESRILEACRKAGFKMNTNLQYVNGILENWGKEAEIQGRDVNQKVNVDRDTLNRYYEYIQEEALLDAEKRKKEVYEAIPQIESIDNKMISLSKELSMKIISGVSKKEKEEKKALLQSLESKRAILLTENNFNIDYTDIKYRCDKCNDTGIDDTGQRCVCVKERIGEAEIWKETIS